MDWATGKKTLPLLPIENQLKILTWNIAQWMGLQWERFKTTVMQDMCNNVNHENE